jgi:hypothetical protein
MHPYLLQGVAAEHARDMESAAVAASRASQARRARRRSAALHAVAGPGSDVGPAQRTHLSRREGLELREAGEVTVGRAA